MSAPYQSHLFQSIQSQARQAKEAVQRHWRQLSHVTMWGMQVGLYSLSRLFQVGRWSTRTLAAQAVHGARQLRASLGIQETNPPVDQPIQKVLAALTVQSHATPSTVASTWQVMLTPLSTAKPLWQRGIELLQACTHLLGIPSAAQPLALPMPSGRLAKRTPKQSLQRSGMTPHPWLSAVSSLLPRLLLTRPSGWLTQQDRVTTTAIQGVASSLIHRQLVLVATNNQVLDILTTAQQQQLSTRIVTELASALKSGSPRTITPHSLRSLSPRRLMRQLPVGIRRTLMAGLGAIALLPFTVGLPEPAQAATPALPLPISSPIAVEWLMDPVRARRRTEEETSLTGPLGRPAAGKVRVPIQKTPTTLQGNGVFPQEIMEWVARHRPTTQSGEGATVDVKAVFAGYQPHVLERLLHGLDRGLAWLEPRVVTLWQRWWPVMRQAMQTAVAIAKPWIAAQWNRFWQQGWPVMLRVSRQILMMLFTGLKALLTQGWKRFKPAVQKWVQARFQVRPN